MALNFPTSPTLNQEYTLGTKTWVWDNIAWTLKTTGDSVLDEYQPLLVSGTNIKTINNASLLGFGNIDLGGEYLSLNGGTLTGSLQVTGTITRASNILLDASNYTEYTPSVTGTGAYGLWNISVLGSAGYVVTRTLSVEDATSVTMNCDTTDIATQANTQATGTLTINAPTGTPVNGQKIMLRLTSANVQTFSWNAIFRGSTDLPLPPASSGAGKEDYLGFIYDSSSTKWDLIAKNFGY